MDLVPAMIESAIQIAQNKSLDINYRIGDATSLDFENDFFDYVLFSNQGWTQIPSSKEREKALSEVFRILKKMEFYFYRSPTYLVIKNIFFWIWQWIRFYVFKPLDFNIPEIDFGDRFLTEKHTIKEKLIRQNSTYILQKQAKLKTNKTSRFQIIRSKW